MDVKVTTKIDAQLLDWTLGSCGKTQEYADYNVYYEKSCCVRPGNYTLACYNTKLPYGWKKGKITINGQDYCDDFMGYKALRRVTIIG